MRTPFLLILVAAASVGGCKCGKKKEPAKKPPPPPIIAPEVADDTGKIEFDPPVKQGVRRFSAPKGQEITSVSGSRDAKLLAAATAKNTYLWDPGFGKARVVDLPLSTRPRSVVALSDKRVAVFSDMPTGDPQTRIWFVDGASGKKLVEKHVAGTGAIGEAFANARLAVVVSEPPAVALFDGDGNELGQGTVAAKPRRIDVASNGSWGVVVGEKDVTVLDASGASLAVTPLAFKEQFTPVVAQILGDHVLVAGAGASDRPLALVVPRAGGAPVARVELGLAGKVVGAALAGDGSRVLVLVASKVAEEKTEQTASVIDPTTWKVVGTARGGAGAVPTTHAVLLDGPRALLPDCHGATLADLQAITLTEQIALPAPGGGPCLDGLYLVGDRVAAREGSKVVTWPKP